MIKNLHLHNFKSARDLSVPLNALTVLSGLNGAGKSTVLQALALLLQNINTEDSFEQVDKLHVNGKLTRLGTIGNILSDRTTDQAISFTLTCDFGDDLTISAKPGQDSQSDILLLDEALPPILSTPLPEIYQFLQADRLTPQTLYDRSDSLSRSSGFLGCHGEFTPDFLAARGDQFDVSPHRRCALLPAEVNAILASRISNTPKLYSQISRWLQHLSPGVDLNAEHLSDTDSIKLAFSYASPEIGLDLTRRRPIHVGFGLTYCLPVLTACLAAPEGALLMLENPEAHLHPRGQAAMGLLLAKCAKDGVQILVETHSDHLLNGIRLAVKHQEIEANQVQLCHFKRTASTGDSYIEAPKILPSGELSEWPDGFFDEWEKSLDALLG